MMPINHQSNLVKLGSIALLTVIAMSFPDDAFAQRGQGRGDSADRHDQRHNADREVFQYLLANHGKIKRTVKELPNGVETLTESETPEVAAKIKEHVEWMTVRIKEANPIRMRDPLFAEIFKHTDKIEMQHENTEKGVRVTETSNDPTVVKLIQAHAKVVSSFVERGFAEAMKNHPVPAQWIPPPHLLRQRIR